MSENKVSIQNIIETQIPEFLNEESPLFREFLEAYYTSEEHPTGSIDFALNLPKFKDLKTYNNELLYTLFVPCTLSSDATTFTDEIKVNHTIGFPHNNGLLKIKNEIISYKTKTDTSFLNCSRGFSGIDSFGKSFVAEFANFVKTKAEFHASGEVVNNLNLVFYTELFRKFKAQFLPGFENREFNSQIQIKNILSRAVDFYTTKGTDTSYKILFQVLYGKTISMIKPQDYLLRPSDDNFFVTKNVLVEKIKGTDPLQLKGRSLFQNNGGTSPTSAAIYSIEFRPIDNKNLYEIYLDSTSFTSTFKTTKKTNVSKSVVAGSSTIDVDSTIGFPNSGSITVNTPNAKGSLYEVTYTDRTNTQFLGCSNVLTNIDFGDEIFESNFVYTYDDDGNTIEFRLINVIGEVDLSNTSNLLVDDKIALSSFGAELSDKPEFYSWIYNVATNHDIKNITLSNATSGKIYRVELYDKVQFFLDQEILLLDTEASSDPGLSATVINLVSDNIIEISCNQNALGKNTVKTIIIHGKSDTNHTPSVNNIPISVQNTYIDNTYQNFYVAATGLPNYTLYSQRREIKTSTPIGLGTTDILNTNVKHKFYTGEKIYYTPGPNSGIATGIYHVTAIGDIKDSEKIKLSLSKSDLYSKKYISFNNSITSDSFVKLDYENKTVLNQKLFKRFNYIKNDSSLKQVADRTTNNRQIGILVNGTEIYSPTLFDENVYYGKLDSIIVTNPGKGYDVINPPELEIADVSGTGAKGYLNIVGGLKEVKIVTPGIGYQTKPKVTLIGGNGSGAVIEPNLVKSQIVSGFKGDGSGVNPTTDIITFANKHNFDDGEAVAYNANSNAELVPLKTNAVYYVGVLNPFSIKLFETVTDAYAKTNQINLVGISSGFHSFKTLKSKNTITEVYVKESGSGYSNRLVKVPSILAYDGTTNGVNTFDNYIYAQNHKFKNRDILRYSTTGSVISGLSTSLEYVVTVIDDNKFKLSEIGGQNEFFDVNYTNKSYTALSGLGTGVHTFSYPPIRLQIETLSGVAATSIIEPEFLPVVLGSIDNVFLEDPGVGYGVSDIINFHRRPDVQVKDIKSEALLKPIVVNGSIVDVQFLTYGDGYDKGIDIVVNGEGNFADIRPVVVGGKITAVNIANGGIGYNKDTTSLSVQRRGIDAKFISDVYEWKINQVQKNSELLTTQDEGFIAPSKVKEFGLQLINFYVPKILRRTLKDHIDNSNREELNNVHSPIIGWAYDGNPIYGPYGQVGSQIQKIRSSYTKKVEPNSKIRPSGFPDGFFLQDYYFDRAIGDLDEHNGRFCKTPDYPDGIYAYFATIDNSAVSKPEFPYILGNYFRDYVIPENYATNFNQSIDISKLNLIRNIGSYYINSSNSNYDLISNTDKKYKQEFTVTKTTSSSVDDIQIYSPGDGYRVGDNIDFDNFGSGGSGASAVVSRIRGKDISSISVGISTNLDVKFYTRGNIIVGITQRPHEFVTGETIIVSAISSSSYSYLQGSKEIIVLQKTVGITTDIDVINVTGQTTHITVNDVSGFEVNDLIKLGDEEMRIVRILPEESQFVVNRISNTGVHTVGIDSVKLLPTRFTFTEPIVNNAIRKNEITYFDAKSYIGFGTLGANYTLSDQTNLSVPAKAIYIKNHNFVTGQQVKYHVGFGGAGLVVSQVIGNPFVLQDGQTLYTVNLGRNFIGLSTVGYTSTTNGIGSVSNSLYIFDDVSVTGSAHSLTTTYDEIIGKVENYSLDVVTVEPHQLKNLEDIKFNLLPRVTNTFKVRYDTVLRKLTTQITSFDASSDVSLSTSEIYLPNNHFNTGDKIVYYTNGNNVINGLTNNGTYFVIKEKPDYIRLAEYYVDSKSGSGITFNILGTGTHGIALINPSLIATKGNFVEFDLSDPTLSGMDLKLYKDNQLLVELESFRYTRNSIDAGSSGAFLRVDSSLEFIQNTLFYNLIPLSPNVIEKRQISIDDEVIGNNKITLSKSIYNQEYRVVSLGSTSFKFNLSDKPEYFSYTTSSGINTIFYDTNSKTASGPISKIKLNFGGKGYIKVPKIRSIDTKDGENAIIKASSKTIGKIDYIDRVKDGFDYPTDPTLRPVLSVPTVCQIKNISRVDYIGINTGGSGYNTAPTLKVIGDNNIKLRANVQGGSVVSVDILENVANLSAPLRVVPTRNSNGYDIDDIVYNYTTNEVTLELVNSDNQVYPLITNAYGQTSVDFPFAIGDRIFVENCRISDSATKNNYNSSDYSYRFFTVTGVSTSNFTVTYSMENIADNLGNYNTDINFGYVINEKVMSKFTMKLVDDLGYASGEDVIGYDSNGFQVFSARVMENGWNNDINQLRLIDSQGELEVGNKLLGTRTRLFGVVENVNQFNLISSLDVTREKINDFKDKTGYLNDYQQRISDNNYYQKFSYSIKSELPYSDWKEAVRSLVHPAGFKEFSDLDIVQKASNQMKVIVNDFSLNVLINIDNKESMFSRNNFSMVSEDELLPDGSIERIFFPDGINLKSYILSKTNKVIPIDDISGKFTGFTTTTGGQIVGLSTFSLTHRGFPLFFRKFLGNDGNIVSISKDTFKIENHNFQTGQRLFYSPLTFVQQPVGVALTTVDVSYVAPTISATYDSPIESFDSTILTYDGN